MTRYVASLDGENFGSFELNNKALLARVCKDEINRYNHDLTSNTSAPEKLIRYFGSGLVPDGAITKFWIGIAEDQTLDFTALAESVFQWAQAYSDDHDPGDYGAGAFDAPPKDIGSLGDMLYKWFEQHHYAPGYFVVNDMWEVEAN